MIPELQNISAKHKVLPLGRHSCALGEVEVRFVPEGDSNRADIWSRSSRQEREPDAVGRQRPIAQDGLVAMPQVRLRVA